MVTEMSEPDRRSGIGAIVLVAVAYVAIGVGFSRLDNSPDAHRVHFWRLAAWIASAAVAAAQIGYEHYRLHSPPRQTALRAAGAVALGAFGLALAAIIHGLVVATPGRHLLLVALVAWPAITALPAFLAALVIASVLARLSRRT